jgi:RecA-family ATPase
MSIASGHMFHGAEVKQGKVIYAVGEGLRGMKWRVEAWKLAHPDADIDALNENLIILPNSVHLLEKADVDKLINTVTDTAGEGGLSLFIVDTWARALTGGDENSAGDAGRAVAVCDTVRDITGATVLVVHHTGADGLRERGSTALRGASDTTLQLSKQDDSDVTVLSCKKMKDGERFQNILYRLDSYGHSAALVPHTGLYGGQYPAPPAGGAVYRKREDNPFR